MLVKSKERLSAIVDTLSSHYKTTFGEELSKEDLAKWVEAAIKQRQDLFVENRLGGLRDEELVSLTKLDEPEPIKTPEPVVDEVPKVVGSEPVKAAKKAKAKKKKKILVKTGV